MFLLILGKTLDDEFGVLPIFIDMSRMLQQMVLIRYLLKRLISLCIVLYYIFEHIAI